MSSAQSHADDEDPESSAIAEERMVILLFIRSRATEFLDRANGASHSVEVRRHFNATYRELRKLANEIEREEHLK